MELEVGMGWRGVDERRDVSEGYVPPVLEKREKEDIAQI